jgi:hypothetical protein
VAADNTAEVVYAGAGLSTLYSFIPTDGGTTWRVLTFYHSLIEYTTHLST